MQFDEKQKLVITNNHKPHKYKVKDGITYWDALKESPKAVIVNSFFKSLQVNWQLIVIHLLVVLIRNILCFVMKQIKKPELFKY